MRSAVLFALITLTASALICQQAVSQDQVVQVEAGPWRDAPYEGAVTRALAWLGPNLVVVGTPRGVLISDVDGRHREIGLRPPLTNLVSSGTICAAGTGDRFACLIGTDDRGAAVVLSAEGAVLGTVTTGNPQPAFDSWAAWARDGTRLCFSGATGSVLTEMAAYRLWLYDFSDASAHAITGSGPWIDACPTFAPGGTRIVYSRTYHDRTCADVLTSDGPARESRVMLFDATDDSEVALTEGHVDRKPVSSPDGTHVAFFRLEPDIGVSVWIVEIKSARAWPAIGGDEMRMSYHASLQWTSDGAGLYLASRGKVYRVPILTGPLQRMDLEEPVDAVFAVSPDDAHIAYLTDGGYRIEEVAYAD